MALYQYLCPKCGVALQSAQDVAGRSVRCLGCQAVFTAVVPEPVTQTPAPARPRGDRDTVRSEQVMPVRRDESKDDRGLECPPATSRGRTAPVVVVVVAAALIVAVGVTGLLIAVFRNGEVEPAGTVAQVPAKSTPAAPLPPPAPPREGEEEEPRFTIGPVRPVQGVEEDVPGLPSIRPTRPAVGGGGLNSPDPTGLPRIPEMRSGDPRPAAPRVAAPKGTDSGAIPPGRSEDRDRPADAAAAADGQIPAALLARLKAATVFIKVDAGDARGSGSGFVLRVDGDDALVVTNDHVALPQVEEGARVDRANYEVVFHSGRKNEFSRRAQLIANDSDHDLAILKVGGVRGATDFPAPLNATDPPPLSETTPVYIIGFPFGQGLSLARGNPAVTIGRGTISSLREDAAGDTAFIQIDGDANPGNSGGPVVDGRGRLVGVLKGGRPGTNINFAIPQIELTRMLTGRVGNLEFRVGRSTPSAVEMDVRGALIDPLDRVKSATLRVVRADSLNGKPAVGADGKWAALPGSKPAELRVSGPTVSTRVELPVRPTDRGQIDILFQPVCVDKQGRTTHFAPVSLTLRSTDDPPPGVPAAGFPRVPGFPGVPGGPGVGPPGAPGQPPPGFPGAAGPGRGPGAGGGPAPPATPPLPPPPGPGLPGRPPKKPGRPGG